MIPKNTFVNKVYHYGIFILLALVSLALSFVLSACFSGNRVVFLVSYLILYFSSFYLLTRAFENKHNANDNTSGVATLFEIIKKRNDKKVAFILFDNEEKGLLGSKAFNKKYSDILKDKLVINLDCVGNGNHFLFIVKKNAYAHKLFEKLNFACKSDKAFNFEFIEFEKASSNSDYKNFECGIGLSAYTKSKNGMLITGKIHTKNDTFINEKNIEILSEKLVKFIDLI